MEATVQGNVEAVCLSSTGGVPKYSHRSIAIGNDGVEGDYHSGPTNRHKKSGPAEPNTRQITLVAKCFWKRTFSTIPRYKNFEKIMSSRRENLI